ncbi:phosphoenolpyruvate carboxylase type 1 [Litorimonas taeanensis]|uniref:Phosphoenolpyruvate carboxylase n=1 Tax=Litorimonas taeanensis TaxID=568099 RepID=A0A420WIC2_9PROT|nr:phosphoenolpyruvate carboxylase [Litorimonas taeanensis]RKQ70727.1 phosphoenolpyruvate carboxylase type 1 [Litorimonas taeanensis]
MRPPKADELLAKLRSQLEHHQDAVIQDPQANVVKLLAYDISKNVEEREIAFKDIEALIKQLSDQGAIARARRLRRRAGLEQLEAFNTKVDDIAKAKAKEGWEAFKNWAEKPGLGIVLTAHPTFSLSRDIRNCLGALASKPEGEYEAEKAQLKTHPYLPKRAPTLIEEHEDTQATLERIQGALNLINSKTLSVAQKAFPKQWKTLTPHLADAYSWVGYDIDGRTDISWGDALRLRLSEKYTQLQRYLKSARNLQSLGGLSSKSEAALDTLVDKLSDAAASSKRDLTLFEKDITLPENLVAAANNLTRGSTRRFTNLDEAIKLLGETIEGAGDDSAKALIVLRAQMVAFGLGTARIHFRLNARHVLSAIKPIFGMDRKSSDNRTLLNRATKLTKEVEALPVNFASLALEKSTAHEKMILSAQIHKYIDDKTPIRLLIAETEDSLVPLGVLYLARLYGLENHLDISPLFETADALNNGGRIIGKMLANPVYRDYVKARGIFAIQTGFSDAGRFMGQIPATLAIERLHSHFAHQMEKYEMQDVTPLVFNTHGEGLGRGGHPGAIEERVDYAMSPWAIRQFEKRGLHLCHELSFQGGDGFLWFQTPAMAEGTTLSLIAARYADRSQAEDDSFYTENDFSWDIFRTIGSEQDSLYRDPNYLTILGGFGQNVLIPTGSRAVKRAQGGNGTDMFNPRQLRAIPHNAILQQFSTPANIIFGVGRAAAIDPEKFANLLENSARARSIFRLVAISQSRTQLSALTAYGRLFDPGFWISRALSGIEPMLAERCLTVADTLSQSQWRSQITDLANRLRMDQFNSDNTLGQSDLVCTDCDPETLKILHALRLAVVMKMMIIATDLPAIGDENTSQMNVLQRLQTFQIDQILEELKQRYPENKAALTWTEDLVEEAGLKVGGSGGYPHIAETIIKPMERASQLVRQITIAITHQYDAFG